MEKTEQPSTSASSSNLLQQQQQPQPHTHLPFSPVNFFKTPQLQFNVLRQPQVQQSTNTNPRPVQINEPQQQQTQPRSDVESWIQDWSAVNNQYKNQQYQQQQHQQQQQLALLQQANIQQYYIHQQRQQLFGIFGNDSFGYEEDMDAVMEFEGDQVQKDYEYSLLNNIPDNIDVPIEEYCNLPHDDDERDNYLNEESSECISTPFVQVETFTNNPNELKYASHQMFRRQWTHLHTCSKFHAGSGVQPYSMATCYDLDHFEMIMSNQVKNLSDISVQCILNHAMNVADNMETGMEDVEMSGETSMSMTASSSSVLESGESIVDISEDELARQLEFSKMRYDSRFFEGEMDRRFDLLHA